MMNTYKDFAEDDVIECYKVEWRTRKLVLEGDYTGVSASSSDEVSSSSKKIDC
jgi:hypothetical protein